MGATVKTLSKVIRPLIHVLAWSAFFFYPFIFHQIAFEGVGMLVRITVPFLLLIVFFYSNTSLLIPHLLGKKKILLYILSVLGFMVVTVFVDLLVQYFFNTDYQNRSFIYHNTVSGALMSSLLVLGISSGWKITSEWYRNERLKKEMEHEKLASELAFLKSQVNPHFLFNSLNSIYALANKESPQTADAVIKLSDLMRYMLYDSTGKYVELDKEVEYLNNYINLQKLRVDGKVDITFDTKGELNKKIAPLLLIPFVENAFKHGISYQNESFVHVEMMANGKNIHFVVENTLNQHKPDVERASGVGLKNVKRRLELLYPGKHKLVINESNGKYIAELNLQINND